MGYFTVAEARWRRTLGKAAMGVRVIGDDGHLPTAPIAIARNSWLLLPIIPWLGTLAMGLFVLLIAITILSSPMNTGWHDELAHTAVVAAGADTES